MKQGHIRINDVRVVFYDYDKEIANRVKALHTKNQEIYNYKNRKGSNIKELEPFIEKRYQELVYESMDLNSDKDFGSSCKKFGSNSRCKEFSKQWDIESKSSYYWIRYICKSLICTGPIKPDLVILKWDEEWKKCVKYIQFFNKVGQDRVILGAGPSGCGKTTIAKKMFPALGINDVVSIDGGYSREMSMVWNITTALNPNGISDIYDIFKQNSSKDELFEFITKRDKTNGNGYCGIYIPDTLVNLTTSLHLYPSINKYIQYDSKHWIGLLIWQHLNNSENSCFFTGNQTCTGCDVSGENRQMVEGKKYSSGNYKTSMLASVRAISSAPYKFIVHNSGKMGGVDTMLYDIPEQREAPYGFVPPEIDLTKLVDVVHEKFNMDRPDFKSIEDKFKLLNNKSPSSKPLSISRNLPIIPSEPPPAYTPSLPPRPEQSASLAPALPALPVAPPRPGHLGPTEGLTPQQTIQYIERVAQDLLRVTAELSRKIAGGKRTRRRRTKHRKLNR